MNAVILCEGKTDAILLSYYLGKMRGWQAGAKPPKWLEIKPAKNSSESVEWYQRGDDRLLICGVGGKDRFAEFFKEKILPPLIDSSAFSKMAVVTDRDNRSSPEIVASIYSGFKKAITDIKENEWTTNCFEDGFGLGHTLSFLLLIIPNDSEGALETVLMNAIMEDQYDKVIVEKSQAFVKEIKPDAMRYLCNRRLELKAQLSVTWAIQSPDKAFDFIDEQIRSVPWEKLDTISQCFSPLLDI